MLIKVKTLTGKGACICT